MRLCYRFVTSKAQLWSKEVEFDVLYRCRDNVLCIWPYPNLLASHSSSSLFGIITDLSKYLLLSASGIVLHNLQNPPVHHSASPDKKTEYHTWKFCIYLRLPNPVKCGFTNEDRNFCRSRSLIEPPATTRSDQWPWHAYARPHRCTHRWNVYSRL